MNYPQVLIDCMDVGVLTRTPKSQDFEYGGSWGEHKVSIHVAEVKKETVQDDEAFVMLPTSRAGTWSEGTLKRGQSSHQYSYTLSGSSEQYKRIELDENSSSGMKVSAITLGSRTGDFPDSLYVDNVHCPGPDVIS